MFKKNIGIANELHSNVFKVGKLIKNITEAVIRGDLKEPFFPRNIHNVLPNWPDKTYIRFPWLHRLQNPKIKETALFFYCGDGIPKARNPKSKDHKYRLLRKNDK